MARTNAHNNIIDSSIEGSNDEVGLRDEACVREYEKAVALKRGLT